MVPSNRGTLGRRGDGNDVAAGTVAIENATVILVDPARSIIEGGHAVVTDGVITAVGAGPSAASADRSVDGSRTPVAFDLGTPWSTDSLHPVGAPVHPVRGLDARHVLVDGELLVEDGPFTRVSHEDPPMLPHEARGRTAAAASRAGLL
jgi:cytosine/adenosine deaminase-related metal-dependent hydrolase